MSPGSQAKCTLIELTCLLAKKAQQLSNQMVFKGDHRYCSVTALSEPLSGFGDIHRGYRQVKELCQLSFFHMEPDVVTAAWLREHLIKLDSGKVLEKCIHVNQTLIEGNQSQCKHVTQYLFLDLLKNAYNFRLVQETLAYFRVMLQIHCTARDLLPFVDLEVLCSPDSYLCIEECWNALWTVIKHICTAVEQQGAFSQNVLLAIYFIKNHYMEEITLIDIAEYVNVNPNYLSGIFGKETGQTVRSYVIKERIRESERLLKNSEMSISQIAESVGFHDHKYFSRIFQNACGLSPAEYRKQIK